MPDPGLQKPQVIDLISQRREGKLCLIICETRRWDGSRGRLAELQAKINAYISFVLDGQLAKQYPQHAGDPVTIQLDCGERPDPATQEFLDRASDVLAQHGMALAVRVIDGYCG